MAIEGKQGFRIFVLLSAAGHLSLLPLLFTPAGRLFYVIAIVVISSY
jgi:hypothetical protein